MAYEFPLKPITRLVIQEFEHAQAELRSIFAAYPDVVVIPTQTTAPGSLSKSLINYVCFEFLVNTPIDDTLISEMAAANLLRQAEDILINQRRIITEKIAKQFPKEKRIWRLSVWTDNADMFDLEEGVTCLRRLVISFALKPPGGMP